MMFRTTNVAFLVGILNRLAFYSICIQQSNCFSFTNLQTQSFLQLDTPLCVTGRSSFSDVGLYMGRPKTKAAMTKSWYPRKVEVDPDDIFADVADTTEELEEKSIQLMTALIEKGLDQTLESTEDKRAFRLAQGRFLDLTCTKEGETLLENLFDDVIAESEPDEVIRGAVIALQSLLVMGTQVGVKGSQKQLQNMVAHLWRRDDNLYIEDDCERDVLVWDFDSIRRLKHRVDITAGTQLLAELKKKRSSQGAFDLLVELGAWEPHEDLPLLRSGFPIHFTKDEEDAAEEAISTALDPDELLGLRQDLRDQKIYTIDSADTSEIDDGLSVEILKNDDGSTRHRFWIHIADVDRWAPPTSKIAETAKRRSTTNYLPNRVIPMFPHIIAEEASLTTNRDVCALSLGVELLDDGSIDTSSIVVMPSKVSVSYRLTYEDVDEMLEEGVGYSEEWQLGALLDAAKKRRQHRIENGSTEGFVPNQIPQATVSVTSNPDAIDGFDIDIRIEASQNAGINQTEGATDGSNMSSETSNVPPLSPAYMMVTEMMIMAGEALPKWKLHMDKNGDSVNGDRPFLDNSLVLPFRGQPHPDFKSRGREVRILNDLREGMQGGGFCHAWYARRFFKPVTVSDMDKPHYGLGLDCYVQWSSPIRRLGDLQVHSAVKRYLRRQRLNEMMENGLTIPSELCENALGCAVPIPVEDSKDENGKYSEYLCLDSVIGDNINFKDGIGLVKASRNLQRLSQQYWVFEHLDRTLKNNPEQAVFDALVLGCTDPDRLQYAVYIQELGLEHRYLSEIGQLLPGMSLKLRVASVTPRMGLLKLAIGG